MARRWGLGGVVAVLLCAACPAGHDPYTAAAPVRYDASSFDVPTTSTTTTPLIRTVRPRASRSTMRVYRAPTLDDIARCESGGRYDAENRRSSASGKYQVLDSTWDGYGGYARAKDAPPEVQEQWAREAFARSGSRPWAASRHCWGR